MIYITVMYMFMIAVFISAFLGYYLYKVSDKKLSKMLSYVVGGVGALLISYPFTMLLLFGGAWFYHVSIAVLSVVVYVAFILFSNDRIYLLKWVGGMTILIVIAAHFYLIVMSSY